VADARRRRALGRALKDVLASQAGEVGAPDEQGPGSGLFGHGAHAALFQLLLDRPMTNVAQAARALGTSPPSARWHLSVLEQAGVVETRRQGREVVAFVRGTAQAGEARALSTLRRPAVARVLQEVIDAPGSTMGELARAAGTSPASAARALRALSAARFVQVVSDGRARRCYPGGGLGRIEDERAQAMAGHARRVQLALEQAGETVSVVRRGRGEVTLAVGRRGQRREFTLRSLAPMGGH
jgi:DNA-binding transcriptional ArsR family regulator